MVTTSLLQIYYEIDLLFKSPYQVLDIYIKKVSVILGDFFLVTCPISFSAATPYCSKIWLFYAFPFLF